CCASFTNCSIHVGYQITGSLKAERIWDRCLESEDRQAPHRRQDQLRHRAAGGGRYREYALLCGCPTEGRDQASDETVEIFRAKITFLVVILGTSCSIRTI